MQPATGLLLHAAMRRCSLAYTSKDEGEYRVQLGDEAFEVTLHSTPKKQAQTVIAVGLDSSDAYQFIRQHRSESGVDIVIGFQTSKERRICASRVTDMFERVLYFEVL